MGILNYTTTIDVAKTAGNVQAHLARRGVTRVATIYNDEGRPAGVSFVMNTDYGIREFELPIRVEGVYAAMLADDSVPRGKKTIEQAERVAWRIAEDWLKAQSALIDAQLARLDEVMLPFMVDASGRTAYTALRTAALAELES